MEGERLVWIALSVFILFLVWKTVEPFLTPIIFGLAVAYIVLPVHHRLALKTGERESAILITALMGVISILLLMGVVLWLRGTLNYIYTYIVYAMDFINRPDLPGPVQSVVATLGENLPARIQSSLLNYSLSVPLFVLQIIVFLGVFFVSLQNARFLYLELNRLIPAENRELGEALIKRAESTLSALLRTWFLLSTLKGIFLVAGFMLFGIGDTAAAIAAGVLCVILELLPVIGGWVLWLAGAIYLYHSTGLASALLFALYGAVFISPIPDVTIRPRLVGEGARINGVVALIGIFGGLIAFGFKGLIIGPVSLALLQTLMEEWKEREREALPVAE
ncbi:AI-2E family transporter [Palaeococcus ferrophilus]|uniref:AI-2E family transporter n=1 Tax=Palaeococcus ferrophilus TaxID=83868 RepID=UPI00064E9F3A|nr:AI-2E family transporter [Palaeococcus ferrophilus]